MQAKKLLCLTSLALCMLLTACGDTANMGVIGGADGPTDILVSKGEKEMYKQITAEEAKRIMDNEEDYVILDVKEQDEFGGIIDWTYEVEK